MHRFRFLLLAAFVAAVLASPAAAHADPKAVTHATIRGLENGDGTYVDGVVVELEAVLESSDAEPRPHVTTEHRLDADEWVTDTRVWISGEGTHTVSFRSRQDAQDPRLETVERTQSLSIVIRSPQPVTDVSTYHGLEGAGGTYVGTVELELNVALDWPDGACHPPLVTEYKLDDGEWVTGTSLGIGSQGTHTVSYRSRYYPSWAPIEVVEKTRSKTITIGTPVPRCTATVHGTGYGDGMYLGPVYVGLTATVDWPNASPPALGTEYSLDGGKTWTPAIGVEIAAAGVTQLLYRSYYIWWNVDGRVVEPAKAIEIEIENPLPVTRAAVSGRAGLNGWFTLPVSVAMSARMPDRSPIERTEYSLDGSTWTTYEAPFVIAAEGTTTVTFRSTSSFGGVEADKSVVVRIDTLAPTLEAITAADGLTIALGADVRARWYAADTGSGLAGEWGSLDEGSPLDTTSVGSKAVVVGASDLAGNEAWLGVDYRVVYEWGGFGPETGTDPPNVFDAGMTVPLRFSISDDAGRRVENARAKISVLKVSDSTGESSWAPTFGGAPTSGDTFVYDAATGMYGFNLDTRFMSYGTYRVTATLDDGTSHDVQIAVRR